MRTETRSFLIISISFAVMIANNGFILAGLTAFDAPILRELGISVTALKIRDTITILTLGATVPVVGYLIDRFRVIPIVVAGLAIMATGFLAYPHIHSLFELYLVQVLLGASQASCGVVCHVVLIARWTNRNRGLALGTLVAGSSFGNAIIPAFNSWLLNHMEWRHAVVGGGATALALIPLVLLIYRERPAEAGVSPGGVKLARAPERFRTIYSSRNFWLLAATAALTVFCVLGLSTNLALYVQRALQGSMGSASALLFLLFIGAVGAQIVAGFAADRVGAARVHILAVSLMAAGALMLGVLSRAWLAPAVFLFGVGWGGNSAMLQLRPATLFAGAAIGRTLAALAVVETLGGGIGPSATGYFYDQTGSYAMSFAVIGALAVLALLSTSMLRGSRVAVPRLAAS